MKVLAASTFSYRTGSLLCLIAMPLIHLQRRLLASVDDRYYVFGCAEAPYAMKRRKDKCKLYLSEVFFSVLEWLLDFLPISWDIAFRLQVILGWT